MRPTAFGGKSLGFLGLLLAAFFVSPYTNLFFLQIAFFCVLLGASVVWCVRNVQGVGGRLIEPRPFAAGARDVALEAQLTSTRRTCRAVRLELQLEDDVHVVLRDAVDIARGATTRIEGVLPQLPRGIHAIRAAYAVSTFPFGLFRASRRLEAPPALIVFPSPAEIPGLRGGGGLAAAASALGDGPLVPGDDIVSSLREWRDGDSMRRMHWRATARRGRPIVKEQDGDSGGGLAVVFDRRGEPERIERALAELSALALAARERAEPLELVSQGMRERFGEGGAPIDELLRWLAATDVLPMTAAAPPSAPAGALRLPRRVAPGLVHAAPAEATA